MSGKLIGYSRVSTIGQSLEYHIKALNDAGCDRIFTDKATGISLTNRPGWAACLDYLRDGDELVIISPDRLGRNISDLANIIAQLRSMKVSLRCLTTGLHISPTGLDYVSEFCFKVYGCFAELEKANTSAKQRAGIDALKQKPELYKIKYPGRKPMPQKKIDQIIMLKKLGATNVNIAKSLGISTRTVYRYISMNQDKIQHASSDTETISQTS